MSINIGPAAAEDVRPKIMVIGVGGAGGNAIANMIDAEIEGVDFIVANTDAQALSNSAAEKRIQLGPDITGGLGAGARPEVGKAAAEETVQDIEDALDGVNMCFIAAGMGGGTGTGAAPIIAEAARRKGVLTVGVVTKPFLFEGTRRMRAAEAGIDELQKNVDTLIVIPNQNLFLIAKADTTFKQAFELADEVLQQGVRSITDLMVMPGLINLDFADVRSVMSEMGKAMMGTGEGEGENRALEAAEHAIANPLLDGVSMQGAKGVIISIIGGEDMKLLEVDEAANHIRELVDDDANIIWGSAFNPDLDGKIRVSVVATGIEGDGMPAHSGSRDSQSVSLGGARAPKRPVLELPEEDEESFDEPAPVHAPEPEPETAASDGMRFNVEPLELGGSMMDSDDEFDDVDDIVDPLAGIRNDSRDDEGRNDADEGAAPDPTIDDGQGMIGTDGGFASRSDEDALDLLDEAEEPRRAPLDLTDSDAGAAQEPQRGQQDDLLRNADRLSDADRASPSEPPAQPAPQGNGDAQPGRRRGLVSGDSDGGGSTLFERMANLSRGGNSPEAKDEDGDDDDDNAALSIPRFLGRQNNQ